MGIGDVWGGDQGAELAGLTVWMRARSIGANGREGRNLLFLSRGSAGFFILFILVYLS